MRGIRTWILAVTFVLVSASGKPAFGQVSAKDTQVIARTMTFLDPAPTGVAEIGILYAQTAPESVAQANLVAGLFGAGVTVSRLTVRPRLVTLASLPNIHGLSAIFITEGLGNSAMAVAAAARRLHVPTISTDLSCVQQGICTVGVNSTMTVRIVLSHAACQDAGISFIQAFRILVTEQ
jgi:hypothetical protein